MDYFIDGSGDRLTRNDQDEFDSDRTTWHRPAPGKCSRTHGGRSHGSGIPGKVTLTSRLPPRIDRPARSPGLPEPDAAGQTVVTEALGGTGHPLPRELRGRLEGEANADLSDIRIHQGPRSAAAAEALEAEAFTVGRDIHFAAGKYDPKSSAGRMLLAHEVAHTIQQRGLPSRGLQRATAISQTVDPTSKRPTSSLASFERAEPRPENQEGYLPDSIRARMERAYGQNFSDVRVHPHSPEVGSAHAVTRGREIHFAEGRYQPGTERGDWLIGHELAHVVQQTAGTGTPETGAPALEAEADRAATAAAAGQRAAVQLRASFGMAQAFSEAERREPVQPDAADQAPDRPTVEQGREGISAEADAAQSREIVEEPQDPARDDVRGEECIQSDQAEQETSAPAAPLQAAASEDRPASRASASAGGSPTSSPGIAGTAPTGSAVEAGLASIRTESPGAILDSLAVARASQAMGAYTQAVAASPAALQEQRDGAEERLPELPAPTGLPSRRAASNERATGEPGATRGPANDPLEPVQDAGSSASTTAFSPSSACW